MNYYGIKALSAHGLMDFYDSPRLYHKRYILGEREERFHVEGKDILGTVVDCMLTTPTEFNDRISILDSRAITGKTGDLILLMSDREETSDEQLQSLMDRVGFKKDIDWIKAQLQKPDAVKFISELKKHKNIGKLVITPRLYDEAQRVKLNVLENKFIGHYFTEQSEGMKVYYQVPVMFKFLGLDCKSLYDLVVVNTKTGQYYVSDLKTTSLGIKSFPKTMIQKRLFIQGAFYALPHYGSSITTEVAELMPYFKDSEKNFAQAVSFIVADTIFKEPPAEYWMTSHDLQCTIEGGIFRNGDIFPGLISFVKDIKWHMENNLWEYTRKYYEEKSHKLQIFT